jgi:hypothetical protein
MTTLDTPASASGISPELMAAIKAWDEAAWCLGALALVAGGQGSSGITAAAQQLLLAAGITAVPGQPLRGFEVATPSQLASQATSPLQQAAALASGRTIDWSAQSDETLLAQGQASALGARAFAQILLPAMDGLAGRLAAPGARMLDAGTGVAAMAIAFAQVFPQLQVLGIDIFDRALDLARRNIAASDVAARVTVREQDIAAFADDTGFDLAYIPAPFVARPAFDAGLPRVVAALRPGGWLFVAHGRMGGTAAEDALTTLKTLVYGGTPLDQAAAGELLRNAGLTSVRLGPTPPPAPAITIGQKPA